MKPRTLDDTDQQPGDEPTISSIIAGSGDGRRSLTHLAWMFGGVTGLLVLGALLKPLVWPIPLAKQAEEIVSLPYGAKVLKVENVAARDTGDVWFTLPEPKGPASRLAEVWRVNSLPASPLSAPAGSKPKVMLGTTGHSAVAVTAKPPIPTYSYSDGFYRKSLSYDAKTRQYHFKNARIPLDE